MKKFSKINFCTIYSWKSSWVRRNPAWF